MVPPERLQSQTCAVAFQRVCYCLRPWNSCDFFLFLQKSCLKCYLTSLKQYSELNIFSVLVRPHFSMIWKIECSTMMKECENRMKSLHKRESHGHIAPSVDGICQCSPLQCDSSNVSVQFHGFRAESEKRWESHFHQQPLHTLISTNLTHSRTHTRGWTRTQPGFTRLRIHSRRDI